MVGGAQLDAAEDSMVVLESERIGFEDSLRAAHVFGDKYLENLKVSALQGIENTTFLHWSIRQLYEVDEVALTSISRI